MIVLGTQVRDITTGLEGIAAARCEYLDGRIEYSIRTIDQNSTNVLVEWVPEPFLEKIGDGVTVKAQEQRMGFGV